MWLSNALIADVRAADIKIFYVSYAATRRWAAERDAGEPLVFSGWYWALGAREAGPFRSQSACWRDAWYRQVRHHAPPPLNARNDLFERGLNVAANKRKRGAV